MSEAPLWLWFALAGLLLLSGAFSSSETALFSLDASQRARASSPARRLLERPRDLLVTVLLGNLVINVLFFAFAARLGPGDHGTGDLLVGGVALVAVVVFGEIFPKVLGLRAAGAVARLAAPLLLLLVGALGPLRRFLTRLLEVTTRLLGPLARTDRALTPERLAQVIDRSAERGVLESGEANIVSEILDLANVRVREIMTPRVDLLVLDLDGTNREEVLRTSLGRRINWLPVMEGEPDQIVGRVRLRDLLTQPDRPLAQMVMPVVFVPEVADALDALHTLRDNHSTEAIVVDEWGGTAGIVTLEDVFEEIVGELRVEGEDRRPPAIPLGENRHRVDGGLSIRDWNDHFGFRVVPTEFETVGGFVTAILGRIPRAGDVARFGSLVMEVHEVRGRRVLSVDMYVEEAEGAELVGKGAGR